MPSVTIGRQVTVEEAVDALQEQLGSRYTVVARDRGDHQIISVKLSTLSFATVRLVAAEGSTTFRVHGGGLVIGRAVNELGIARRVAAAIQAAPGLTAAG